MLAVSRVDDKRREREDTLGHSKGIRFRSAAGHGGEKQAKPR